MVETIANVPLLDQGNVLTDCARRIRQIQNTLRLLKSGLIKIDRVYCRRLTPGQYVQNLGLADVDKSARSFHGTYALATEDLAPFSELHSALVTQTLPENLRVCVSRIDSAGDRTSAEDILIDAVVVLETIYGDTGDSLSYKISMRCAAFLEKTFEDRIKCYELVKKIYSLRSEVVHGSLIKGDRAAKTRTAAEDALELARRSVKALLVGTVASGRVPDPKFFDKLLLNPQDVGVV